MLCVILEEIIRLAILVRRAGPRPRALGNGRATDVP